MKPRLHHRPDVLAKLGVRCQALLDGAVLHRRQLAREVRDDETDVRIHRIAAIVRREQLEVVRHGRTIE